MRKPLSALPNFSARLSVSPTPGFSTLMLVSVAHRFVIVVLFAPVVSPENVVL
jgi:hypothetical protein